MCYNNYIMKDIQFTDEVLTQIHNHSINNKNEVTKSNTCGCFYCREIFSPSEIKKFIKDNNLTAECPYCMVDAVIGDASGYNISNEILEMMHKKYFKK